jgi:glycine/D-amino acid oxidase-like deaminating enzyme
VGPSLVSEGHIGRNVDVAQTEKFDVAVIGGGIYGIALIFESARRGFRTVLLERDAASTFDDVIYRRTDWGDDPAATAAARTLLERADDP